MARQPSRRPARDGLRYENDLKPVRRFLGGKQLQQLTKADVDKLVTWMLTEARTSPRHYRADSLAGWVTAMIAEHPEGITAAELAAALPGDVHSTLAALLKSGRVSRLRRGVYAPPPPSAATEQTKQGVAPITVRSALTTFGAVVQSYVDQGALVRNVVALVERPPDATPTEAGADGDAEGTAKSWTLAEVQQFREVARDHRLAACWLLSCYGLRRSEVLGARWSDIADGTLFIRRGRVPVNGETVIDAPKSRRSRRDLPMPDDVAEALRALRKRQQAEALALGIGWSDDRLIAVREDGEPVRPEHYTDTFHRLRERAGLRRIHLKGLRNTSVTLMLDNGVPPHICAAWHGHDPAVSLSIYADAKTAELRAASALLFG